MTAHTSAVTTASVAMADHGQAARVPGHPWPMALDQGGRSRRRQQLDPGPGRPDLAADRRLRQGQHPGDDGSPACRSFKGERKGGGETQPCRRHPRLRPGIPGLAQAEAERRSRALRLLAAAWWVAARVAQGATRGLGRMFWTPVTVQTQTRRTLKSSSLAKLVLPVPSSP